jgi:hypothetical protein
VLLQICLQFLHLADQLVLGGLCSFGGIDGFFQLASMVQDQSVKRFLVLLLQPLGPLRDKILDLLILAAELGGKCPLASDTVFFLSIEQDAALP